MPSTCCSYHDLRLLCIIFIRTESIVHIITMMIVVVSLEQLYPQVSYKDAIILIIIFYFGYNYLSAKYAHKSVKLPSQSEKLVLTIPQSETPANDSDTNNCDDSVTPIIEDIYAAGLQSEVCCIMRTFECDTTILFYGSKRPLH